MSINRRLLALAALVMATAASAEVMTNDTVLTLVKAGLSEPLIIDKINSEPCGYDVSTKSLLALKNSGLSDSLIGAMVRRCASLSQVRGISGDDSSPDPKVRHSPGIYLMSTWSTPPALLKLRPSKASGIRTTGNGSVVFPLITKLQLTGDHSSVGILLNQPTFYFYFNVSDSNVSDFGLENSTAAQSPDEFSLIKFKLKKGAREVDVGRTAAYDGSIVSLRKGIDPRSTVGFATQDEGAGTYRVSMNQALEAGEYAFVFTGSNGAARVYDFSVTTPLAVPAAHK
jgi:hypothetical protein